MAFSLKCPDCRQKFPWKPTDGMPEKCPLCANQIASDRDDSDIVMPFVRSNEKSRRIDAVYRDMERGSEFRAQAAADAAGVPVSEMSALKITNLNDRRDAPIKAIEVHNDISRAMEMPQHRGIHGLTGGGGVSLCSDVQAGPLANAGARMMTAIRAGHSDMVLKHAIGQDADTKRPVVSNHNVSSEMPARETEQPGYRRRG